MTHARVLSWYSKRRIFWLFHSRIVQVRPGRLIELDVYTEGELRLAVCWEKTECHVLYTQNIESNNPKCFEKTRAFYLMLTIFFSICIETLCFFFFHTWNVWRYNGPQSSSPRHWCTKPELDEWKFSPRPWIIDGELEEKKLATW